MANRALLHKSKLEDFKQFLTDNNIPWREGRGDWQVIQIYMGDDKPYKSYPSKTWQVVYEKLNAPEHYTVTHHLENLVWRFINQNNEVTDDPGHEPPAHDSEIFEDEDTPPWE